jgi:hypothetical protein
VSEGIRSTGCSAAGSVSLHGVSSEGERLVARTERSLTVVSAAVSFALPRRRPPNCLLSA